MRKSACCRVEQVESICGTHPEIVIMVHEQGVDVVVAQAQKIRRIVEKMLELLTFRVKAVQSALTRANPQKSVLVFDNGCDPAVAEAGGHIGIGLECFEGIPIVSVQPILGAEPQKAAAILEDNEHRTLG